MPQTNGAASRKAPVAPPVYRPQPVAKVLQAKSAVVQQQPGTQKRPAAPPVYRPQPIPKVLQAKKVTNHQAAGNLVAPKSAPPRSVAPPPARGVVQRLIVLDQDIDVSRIGAAVEIHKKWLKKGRHERITTMHHVNLANLPRGEKLYLVAHGSPTEHGGRTPEQLATLLRQKGLRNENVIKLISCNTGDGENSYANQLANLLTRTNKVIGIRGPELSSGGHTRGSKFQDEEAAMEEYFKLIGNDKTFEKLGLYVAKQTAKLATMPEDEVEPFILKLAAFIEKAGETLAKELLEKLKKFHEAHTITMSKEESENIQLPLTVSRISTAHIRRPASPLELSLAARQLNISVGASDRLIRQTFRRIALTHHPDKTDDPEKHKIFIKASSAYDLLLNKEVTESHLKALTL